MASNESLYRLERELQLEYEIILTREELLWYQKSREQWVRFGDRNTKYFHTQTVVRRKRNRIQGLFLESGEWSVNQDVLRQETRSFFLNLFASPVADPLHLHVATPRLSVAGQADLTSSVSLDEVRVAVIGMRTYSGPVPDGFQPFFFKQFWPSVAMDMWNLVREAFSQGKFDHSLSETLIVPIPKVDHPKHMRDFRPISLCNLAYKVITKVLVNRMRPYISDLIGPL